MKNNNVSNLDSYMMQNRTFNPEKDSIRVEVVDGITLNAESINIPEMKFPEQKVIEVPVIVKEAEVHQVNVPVIVKETQVIEVPKIITEYKTIEVPVIVHELKVVEIVKPVVIKETEFKVIEKLIPTMPKSAQICMFIQAVANITLLLMYILKGKS